MTEDEKKKILDLQMSKEEQEKLLKRKEVQDVLLSKKFRCSLKFPDGKIRYLYGDDQEIFEDYAKAYGAKIIKTEKLHE